MSTEVVIDTNVLLLVEQLNIEGGSDIPQISSKRPFGNSDYYRDVLRHIGRKEEFSNDWGEISEKGTDVAEEYLQRTKLALEILIKTQALEKGTYEKKNGEWEQVS